MARVAIPAHGGKVKAHVIHENSGIVLTQCIHRRPDQLVLRQPVGQRSKGVVEKDRVAGDSDWTHTPSFSEALSFPGGLFKVFFFSTGTFLPLRCVL
jgi:hypothetical protein